ncbi:Fic family protein [Candidatus Parcubacteria bacterium]|nr:Fic family protein [Candidatus Parcubacteria bacterium]
MGNLSSRQKLILQFIQNNKGVSTKEILSEINKQNEKELRRLTIIRDLDILLQKGFIFRSGQGRGVRYLPGENQWLHYFDPQNYFETGPDERKIRFENFNFDIFESYKFLFNKNEKEELKKLNSKYQKRLVDILPVIFQKETERLTIEFVWKSSHIEGNTYSLLDTEFLIKENREAPGHSKFEAMMILNQKRAIDYVFANKKEFKVLDVDKIINLHAMIIKELGVGEGIRKKLVGITGTKYRPISIHQKLAEALDEAVELINKTSSVFEKAILTNLLIAYIQPFNDGNKRTSRMVGNAVLLAHGYCPLSFRSIGDYEYKKAVLLFYEQNSALYFKELFVEQFKFAVDNYFRV